MSARVSTVPKPSVGQRPAPPRRTLALSQQRRIAKTGMAASLGVLVWSALGGRRVLRRYHVLAGVALLGFTMWHMSLYRARDEQDRGLPRRSLDDTLVTIPVKACADSGDGAKSLPT